MNDTNFEAMNRDAAPSPIGSIRGANGMSGAIRPRFGDQLVDEGLLTRAELDRALRHQSTEKKRLGETLIELRLLSSVELLSALGRHLSVKSCVLRHGLIDPEAAKLVSREEAARLRCLPLFLVRGTLTVAMVEPQSLRTIDKLAKLTGHTINPVLCFESNLVEFQEKYLGEEVDIDGFLVGLTDTSVEVVEDEAVDEQPTHELSRMVDGSPIINLVNLAILTAIRDGASDIHVEPTKHATVIRYRIDGCLRELMSAPPGMHGAIISRIKVIGKMDVAERRLPQEGRVHVVAEGREIDLRVSTMPTLLGEKTVLRVLDKAALDVALENLGLRPDQIDRFRRIFGKPHGIALVTGPTGSGKTTTLYSVLDQLSTTEKNTITIEDPVEYQVDAINQIQVNDGIGLTFARALRSILRQDPDVIMVGEMRDAETCRVAIQAALTGHLVLSTLHTNSAPGAFTRLGDMGIEPYLMASAFNGVVAQRLARAICPNCRTTYLPSEAALADAGWSGRTDQALYKGSGCQQCHDSGFRGRIGIFEILEVTDAVRSAINHPEDSQTLQAAIDATGWRPLRDEGLPLVEDGRTTLEEVLRVTTSESDGRIRAERRSAEPVGAS